jgi:hypothetical protein
MNENKINRRDVCKSLLALGGITIGGLAAKGQTPTPLPMDVLTISGKLIVFGRSYRARFFDDLQIFNFR